MEEPTVTIQIPASIFRRLQQAASLTYRSIDEVLEQTVNSALPVPEGVPDDVADSLAAMHFLNDDALKAAAQPSLSPDKVVRLGQLNELADQRELTEAELDQKQALLADYHLAVLRRAQALAILAQRGFPITHETTPSPLAE